MLPLGKMWQMDQMLLLKRAWLLKWAWPPKWAWFWSWLTKPNERKAKPISFEGSPSYPNSDRWDEDYIYSLRPSCYSTRSSTKTLNQRVRSWEQLCCELAWGRRRGLHLRRVKLASKLLCSLSGGNFFLVSLVSVWFCFSSLVCVYLRCSLVCVTRSHFCNTLYA